MNDEACYMPPQHSFSIPDVMNGNPILRCANTGCRVVWWPERFRPKSRCKDGKR